MKEILLITRNDGQCDEWFRYLKKKIPQTMMRDNCRPMAIDILTDNCHIIIRPNSENYYRGRCPDCHYVYGLEADRYLLATGSKRLRSLDDVIDIVKKNVMSDEERLKEQIRIEEQAHFCTEKKEIVDCYIREKEKQGYLVEVYPT